MSIHIDQVFKGLEGCGIEKATHDKESGHNKAECPACRRAGALSFCQDAFNDSFLGCSEGCTPDEIRTALRAGINALELAADDPLAYVREQLEEPELEKVVKHGRMGEAYVLHFKGGCTVNVGNAAALLSQAKFRAAYLPQRRRIPLRFTLKERAWIRFAECIERGAVEQDTVATTTEETLGWLSGYVGRCVVVDTQDAASLYEALDPNRRTPFLDAAGAVYVNLNDFATRLARDEQVRLGSRELSARLSELGFERSRMQARNGADVRKTRFWVSSPGFRIDG